MHLLTRETRHRLIGIVIARYRFIVGVTLNTKAGIGAAVDDRGHFLRNAAQPD